jgi:transposase-like protein
MLRPLASRNALDHLPRKADDDCRQELRWLYDRRWVEEARVDLTAWIAKWSVRYPKLVAWVEETIEVLLEIVHVEVSMGFEPVLVSLDG